MKIVVLFIFLFFSSNCIFSQNYCIHLTKEDKTIAIKEGKTISYSLIEDTLLTKAEIISITTDSITFFIKKEKLSKVIALNKIGAIAYTKKSFWIALPTYYLAMGIISAASNGAPVQPFDFVEPKSFRRNLKIEDGWKATIVNCLK